MAPPPRRKIPIGTCQQGSEDKGAKNNNQIIQKQRQLIEVKPVSLDVKTSASPVFEEVFKGEAVICPFYFLHVSFLKKPFLIPLAHYLTKGDIILSVALKELHH